MINKDTIYEHLGHTKFIKENFMPIVNRESWNKPEGGLWASPVNSVNGWRQWIDVNEFHLDKYALDSFTFKLKDFSKILIIDNASKITDDMLTGEDNDFIRTLHIKILDFEKLSENYDAILILISEDNKLYWDLYGWDCDTLLVLNPDAVEEL